MRSLKRSIARAAMKAAGITRINKRRVSIDPRTGHPVKLPSFFAQNWRKYASL